MMEDSFNLFYPIFFICPLLVCSLAVYKYHRKKIKEFRHLAEFFISLIIIALTSVYFWKHGPVYIVLSVFSWTWTVRTFGQVCEDIVGQSLFHKSHLYILGIGGILSFILLSFDMNLSLVVAPFSFSIGVIGITFVLQAYQKGNRKNFGYLHHLNFLLIFLFFAIRLTFASWVAMPEYRDLGVVADSYLILIFTATLFPLYSQIIFERHEQFLEEVLFLRNKQLFSHSGFSEYKILSAAVTHEINNALTLINAKIEQMMRGREKDPQKGMEIILKSANRIVHSMRGLREFIYPNDVTEILDVGEMMDNVLDIYGQRLKNHGVKVTSVGLIGKMVKGHRIQLEQVFLSLINNSVDAVDHLDEKWIEITCKNKNHQVEISVKDSSMGLDESVVKLLEDPFYSTQNDVMDNGIRLVLAQDILHKHGGSLDFENDEATFIVKLPLDESGIGRGASF